MTQFVRTEYGVKLLEKDNPDQYIRPQAVFTVYQINSVPVARVDLAFGREFGGGNVATLQDDLDRLTRWADSRAMLQVEVTRSKTSTSQVRPEEDTQIIFEGRVLVPSLQLLRNGASNSFQLQHWTGDLMLGSMLISYALHGHPQEATVAGLYKRSSIGNADVTDPQSVQMEGVAYRLGLPANWQNLLADDIWANGQKAILAELAEKTFRAPIGDAFKACKDSINTPSSYVSDAIRRIQGPSTLLGSPYTSGAAPVGIRQDLTPGTRDLLSMGIAKVIGHAPLAAYAGQNFWQKILSFCAEFGLIFIPRPTDAVIIPFNVGSQSIYGIDCEENETLEVNWSAFQQTGVRGVGILSTFHSDIGNSTVGAPTTDLLPHGCYLGSSDPNRGMVHFTAPPRWLSDVPPDVSMGLAAAGSSQVFGVHSPPVDADEPQFVVKQRQHRLNTQNIYNQFAKLRYLESELRGRQIRLGTHYRTDIAPGTMLRVQLRKDRMISRLNVNVDSLVGIVTGITLGISRQRKEPVASLVMDYGRKADQIDDQALSIDGHPIFEADVPGIPLVDLT